MNIQKRFIDKIVWLVAFFWTFLFFLISIFLVYQEYDYAYSLAENEAKIGVKKDLAYRSWVASHGGVYVPITEKTPPNPHLAHIENRDVNTTDNQQLTLMNPAYTLSQMMRDYSELYGTKGHITSKILMNPKNIPDRWESEALDEVEKTRKSVEQVVYIDDKEYFRYLNPLVIKKACLKCHAFQGYKVGDIRGGVSVAIPMKEYFKDALFHSQIDISILFFIWMFGIFTIFYGRKIALKELEKKIKDYEQHIFSMVNMIEKRDSYTAGHTKRVADYSVLIAHEMKYSKSEIDDLYRACMLHDIGKISTPDSILLKPGKLSNLEFEIIKEHVVTSYELLKNVDIYKDIAEIVRYHHEKYDGSGYPEGLKGEETPIFSQIMTVSDAFDAMTTNRIYKARKSVEVAIDELKSLSGIQFHPDIVKAATIALKDVEVNESISQRPQTKLERQRFAYFYNDPVTGVFNREYLEYVVAYNHEDAFNLKCVYGVYLHNFSKYNKEYGWANGDIILKRFARELEDITNEEFIFRMYGDDFVILNREHFDLEGHLYRLEDVLKDTGITFSHKHYDMQKDKIENIKDLEELI